MNTQIGSSWQIIFESLSDEDEILESFLEEQFEVTAHNYTDDHKHEYIGYSSTPIDEEQLSTMSALFNINLPTYKIEFIPATNWLTKNVIKFAPIETKYFLIYGSHEEIKPLTDKLAVQIYAATAFGSGQHQTTKSCLNLLSKLKEKNYSPQNILDMGCGSGILALAALKLFPNSKTIAVDIDEEAIIVTMQNADDNSLSEKITAFQSNGYENDLIQKNGPYDLVMSNILARPLIEMAPQLAQNLQKGGFAILSGFIADQTNWVVEAHSKFGLSLVETYEDENWRAVLMEKTI